MKSDTYEKLKPKVRIPRLNLILFLLTVGTTFGAGYLQSLPLVDSGFIQNPWEGAAAFSLGLMAIIGCHEMGHKLMAERRGVDTTFPYFIPAPTFLGTFGAVIRMRTSPADKNSLFDVGAAGPIAGVLVLLPVTILGLLWSFPVPLGSIDAMSLPEPLLFQWLEQSVISLPSGSDLLLHPLAFAGWIGMIITMLNLMPVGSLDGGHITRALFGHKILLSFSRFKITLHRAISLFGVIVAALLGYWPMAILMLIFGLIDHPGPADDTSPLSSNRKLLGVGLLFILIICATPLPLFT